MAEPRRILVAAELAIRMCEASYGLTRPMPSAVAALAAMDEDCREGWRRAAHAATEYFLECMVAAQVSNDER
jgi:hypothetical protein